MPLPPPGGNVYWKDYEIDTPTFQLTPVEKPDMSPFLVHMTGRGAILSILSGENIPESVQEVPYGHGYLKACVPQYDQGHFDVPVVCFSESPTFALDFFRYRSFQRWRADQRYGIGFDKTRMVAAGVRPVVYVEDAVRQGIRFLFRYAEKNQGHVSDVSEVNDCVNTLVSKLHPLLFPLLEDHWRQGFMWEREWRYFDPNGFVFDHQEIRVICCPDGEETSIRQILGTAADNIDFIRAWREYDDVTNYLRRQQPVWQAQSRNVDMAQTPDEEAPRLLDLIQQYKVAQNSLRSYEEFVTHLNSEMERIVKEKESLDQKIDELEKRLEEVEKKRKESFLDTPDSDIAEAGEIL